MILSELNDSNLIQGEETYLITGANGFIGSTVASALIDWNTKKTDKPCKIILVLRNYDKAVEIYGEILQNENISIVVCDNKDDLLISEKVDWIIHASADTKKENFRNHPVDTLNDNVQGVYHCLELARNKQVKGMVFISSVQVYGKINRDFILEDDFGVLDCMKEMAVYPESKRMGETFCWAYYKQYSVPVKCARLYHVYGEGEQYNNGTFFSDFMNDIIADRDIIIKGSGEEIRNLCHISDVVRGIFYILYKGTCGEAYNIGSEVNNCTIKEIAELLCSKAKLFGKNGKVLIEEKENNAIIHKQIPSVEKIKALGWAEKNTDLSYNLEKLVHEMLRK